MHGNVVLGVTGSIAAFKAAKLASDMVKEGLQVRVILTLGGARFVTPLTFEAITAGPVAVDIWDEQPGTTRMGHLELARWGDVLVVAPATASSLTHLALGLAEDMLGAVALACPAPLILAPAMETGMWQHPATQQHIQTLRDRGATIVGPDSGRLASGATGAGRMSEPEEILAAVRRILERRRDLEGLRVLITAGPTYEPLDPVRFIGNRSSGKMGYAVAEEARDRGASVTLVAGPTSLPDPPGIDLIHVETSASMREAVLDRAPHTNVIVMAAAVADFRPSQVHDTKIKRDDALSLELTPTEDIAAAASHAAPRALHVGFALETGGLIDAARGKLQRKGQQLVVANLLSDTHNPFGSDSNHVAFVTSNGVTELPPMTKRDVARTLWDALIPLLPTRSQADDT